METLSWTTAFSMLMAAFACVTFTGVFLSIKRQFNELTLKFDIVSKEQQRLETLTQDELKAMAKQIKRLTTQKVENEQREQKQSSYSQAAKLVAMGAEISEVRESFNLSKVEAELLMTLHNPEKSRTHAE